MTNNNKQPRISYRAPMLVNVIVILHLLHLLPLTIQYVHAQCSSSDISFQISTSTPLNKVLYIQSSYCGGLPEHTLLDPLLDAFILTCPLQGVRLLSQGIPETSRAQQVLTLDQCPSPTSTFRDLPSGKLFASCGDRVLSMTKLPVDNLLPEANATALAYDQASNNMYVSTINLGIAKVDVAGRNPPYWIDSVCTNSTGVFSNLQSDGEGGFVYAACDISTDPSSPSLIALSEPYHNSSTILTNLDCSSPTTLTGADGVIFVGCSTSLNSIYSIKGLTATAIANSSSCRGISSIYAYSSSIIYATCSSALNFTVIRVDCTFPDSVTITYLATREQIAAPSAITRGPDDDVYVSSKAHLYHILGNSSAPSIIYGMYTGGRWLSYDATDGRLYVSSQYSVYSLNITSYETRSILTFSSNSGNLFRAPAGIYVSTALGLFLTDQPVISSYASNTDCTIVTVIAYNATTDEVTAVCSEDGNYVTLSISNSPVIEQTVSPCFGVNDVYRDPLTGTTYFACNGYDDVATAVVSILSADSSELRRVNAPASCGYLSGVFFSEGSLFIGCYYSTDSLFVIDMGTVSANSSIPTDPVAVGLISAFRCPSPRSIFFSDFASRLWTSCTGLIIAIDSTVRDSLVLRQSGLCPNPQQVIALDEQGAELVLANCNGDSVITSVTAASVTAFVEDSTCQVAVTFAASSTLTVVVCSDHLLLQPRDGIAQILQMDELPNSVEIHSSSNDVWMLLDTGLAVIRNGSSQLQPITEFNGTVCGVGSLIHLDEIGRILSVCDYRRVVSFDPIFNITTTLFTLVRSDDYIASITTYHDIVFVASQDDGLLAFNRTDGSVNKIADLTVCPNPTALLVDQSTMRVLAACSSAKALASIVAVDWGSSPSTVTTISNSTTCSIPTSLSFSQLTRTLYAACDNGIFVISQQFRCYPGYYWNRGECTPCPFHTFRNSSQVGIIGQCVECPRGSITSSVGSASCDDCPAGSFERNRICVLCEVGRYHYLVGQVECLPCGNGTSTSTLGSISCPECIPGTFAADESSLTCQSCDIGLYQNSSRATSCIPCERGKFSSRVGATMCQDCEPGTATNDTQSLSCRLCLPGEYQSDRGQTECLPCAPGRYSLSASSLTCQDCNPGLYAISPGTALCLTCTPGRSSNITARSTECDVCLPGQYQAAFGQTKCEICESQAYSEKPESTSCTRCDSQVNAAKTSCNTTMCDKNTQYNSLTSTCDQCDLGSSSVQGGKCSPCGVNTYTPERGQDCTSCQQDGMEGIVCSGGIASVRPGYWAFLSEMQDRDSGEVRLLYRTVVCPLSYCEGSALQTSNASLANTIQYCGFPRLNDRSNLFCARCVDGYIPWNDKCVACEHSNWPLFFGGFVLSFLLVIFILQSSGSAAGALSILLFFIQTAALEIGPVSRFINWIQVFNFGTNSVSACLANWTPNQQTLFSLCIPLILLGELAFIAIVHYLLFKNSKEGSNSDPSTGCGAARRKIQTVIRSFSPDTYVAAALSILLFCYTQVSTVSFSYLYCVQVDDDVGSRRLFAAPSVDCDSNEYKAYLAPVCIAIIVYVVAFPLGILALLWANKDTLFISHETAQKLSSSSTIPSFLIRYAPLYKMYEPRACYWQPLVLLRRAAFAVVSVVLIQQPAVRFLVFTLLHFASILAHLYAMPFAEKRLNRLDTISYSVLVVMSAVLTGYLPPYSIGVQVIIFLLVTPTAVAICGFVLHEQWTAAAVRLRSVTMMKNSVHNHEVSSPSDHIAATAAELELPPMTTAGDDAAQSVIISPGETFSERETL